MYYVFSSVSPLENSTGNTNRTVIVFVSSVAVMFLRALAYFQKQNLRTDVQNFAGARTNLAKLNDIISSVKVFFMVR